MLHARTCTLAQELLRLLPRPPALQLSCYAGRHPAALSVAFLPFFLNLVVNNNAVLLGTGGLGPGWLATTCAWKPGRHPHALGVLLAGEGVLLHPLVLESEQLPDGNWVMELSLTDCTARWASQMLASHATTGRAAPAIAAHQQGQRPAGAIPGTAQQAVYSCIKGCFHTTLWRQLRLLAFALTMMKEARSGAPANAGSTSLHWSHLLVHLFAWPPLLLAASAAWWAMVDAALALLWLSCVIL